MEIHRAAVLGSGVMGSAIAAHLANAGIPTILLDVAPKSLTPEEESAGVSLSDKKVRNRIAEGNRAKLLKMNPPALFVPEYIEFISVGNFEDDLGLLQEVDWIVEAVVERLDVKQELLKKVAAQIRPGTIVSTNTSGISLNRIVKGLAPGFARYFLGTHFFNPPRYMKLLEIIPGPDTENEIVDFMLEFGERVLGKGVVLAKDSPNFIGNRIGVYATAVTLREMLRLGLRVDEVDALTGPVIGRPKSATFRTLDIVGLDTFVNVARNVAQEIPQEREKFELPGFIDEMLQHGWLGDKAKQGFYKTSKGLGGKIREVLDPQTLTYKASALPKYKSLEQAMACISIPEKIETLIQGDDIAAEFSWNLLKEVLLYAASVAPEVAEDIVAVDNALKWGFNWRLGPFELWDSLGVQNIAERIVKEGGTLPALVHRVIHQGDGTFYKKEATNGWTFFTASGYKTMSRNLYSISLAEARMSGKKVLGNDGASLIDLDDGVACLEFHSPNNTLTPDVLSMIRKSIEVVEKKFSGLVIGNQGKNFCVGANLALILSMVEEKKWDILDIMVREFQNTMMTVKYAKKPVLVAPFGMTLGGGVELSLHSHGIQAAAETYMGLVELSVGIIPAGGGTKEMAIRAMEGIFPKVQIHPDKFIARRFEIVAYAEVSTSGEHARRLGFLREDDRISMNADHQILDAKSRVIDIKRNFKPELPLDISVAGPGVRALLEMIVYGMLEGRYISKYDAHLDKKLAFVITGGNLASGTKVSEQYLLDLEREAFLSLVGEAKTQERIRYMLTKGKPLRN